MIDSGTHIEAMVSFEFLHKNYEASSWILIVLVMFLCFYTWSCLKLWVLSIPHHSKQMFNAIHTKYMAVMHLFMVSLLAFADAECNFCVWFIYVKFRH